MSLRKKVRQTYEEDSQMSYTSASTTARRRSASVWSYSLIPAIFCVIMLVILHFYELEKPGFEVE